MVELIIESIKKCDRNVGAMVCISEVMAQYDGFGFNVALMEAVKSGQVCIYKYPDSVTDENRTSLFTFDGKTYYNGCSIRV